MTQATALPSIDELIADGALFVANHSGGKDSQAMLIRLLERVPASQIVVVHASLGEAEWEGALEHAQAQAENAGLPFIVARSVKTFFEMVEHRYAVRPGPNSSCWPSASLRQCTSDLKRGPIEREVRRFANPGKFGRSGQTSTDVRQVCPGEPGHQGYSKIVTCMGIRAAESPARSKQVPFRRNERNSIAGRDWFDWLPIHDMSTDAVFETIHAAGQQPHWAYAAGNQRLSCVFCIMGSPTDIAHGARQRPELFAKYREIEERTGYTMHQSRRSLAELVEVGTRRLEGGAR